MVWHTGRPGMEKAMMAMAMVMNVMQMTSDLAGRGGRQSYGGIGTKQKIERIDMNKLLLIARGALRSLK